MSRTFNIVSFAANIITIILFIASLLNSFSAEGIELPALKSPSRADFYAATICILFSVMSSYGIAKFCLSRSEEDKPDHAAFLILNIFSAGAFAFVFQEYAITYNPKKSLLICMFCFLAGYSIIYFIYVREVSKLYKYGFWRRMFSFRKKRISLVSFLIYLGCFVAMMAFQLNNSSLSVMFGGG